MRLYTGSRSHRGEELDWARFLQDHWARSVRFHYRILRQDGVTPSTARMVLLCTLIAGRHSEFLESQEAR